MVLSALYLMTAGKMMKRFLLLITAAVLCFCLNFAQSAFAANDNAKYTLTVEVKDKKGIGVILASDGSFLTTFELIKNADYIKAKTQNGKTYIVDGYRYLSPKNNAAILTLKKANKLPYIKYKDLNEINVNDVSIPNSVFVSHIADKKRINTKNINWTKFTAQKLNKDELEEFIDYAEKNDDIPMLYKYLEPYASKCDIPSYRYTLLGTLAISGYLDNPKGNKHLVDNAAKWFALSINSGKNVDASAYGLFLASILRGDTEDIDSVYSFMKTLTFRKALGQLNKINHCKEGDYKCVRAGLFNMCKHLQMLTRKGY